jgi:hypothetical protein
VPTRFLCRESLRRQSGLARKFGLGVLVLGICPYADPAEGEKKHSSGSKPFCKTAAVSTAFATGKWQQIKPIGLSN